MMRKNVAQTDCTKSKIITAKIGLKRNQNFCCLQRNLISNFFPGSLSFYNAGLHNGMQAIVPLFYTRKAIFMVKCGNELRKATEKKRDAELMTELRKLVSQRLAQT